MKTLKNILLLFLIAKIMIFIPDTLLAQEQELLKVEKNYKFEGLNGNIERLSQKTWATKMEYGVVKKAERAGTHDIWKYVENLKFENFSWEFNDKGVLIKKEILTPKGTLCTLYEMHEYAYKDGKEIREDIYNHNLSLVKYYIYEYNEKGQKIEKNFHNDKKNLERKYIYKYKNSGEISKIESYDEKGERAILTGKYKYSDIEGRIEIKYYDSNGNLKKIYVSENNGKDIATYYYDVDGSKKLEKKVTYKYDENGDITEEKHKNEDGDFKIYVYQYNSYDKNKNWTKRTVFLNEEPYRIQERTIIPFHE